MFYRGFVFSKIVQCERARQKEKRASWRVIAHMLNLSFLKSRSHQLILTFSIIAMSLSLGIEFLMDFRPCKLCLVQRYLHALIALSGGVGVFHFSTKSYIRIAQGLLLLSFFVAVTHSLIQFGFVQDFCAPARDIEDVNSFKASLQYTSASCAYSSLRPFDVPLSLVNGLGSISLFLLSLARRKQGSRGDCCF